MSFPLQFDFQGALGAIRSLSFLSPERSKRQLHFPWHVASSTRIMLVVRRRSQESDHERLILNAFGRNVQRIRYIRPSLSELGGKSRSHNAPTAASEDFARDLRVLAKSTTRVRRRGRKGQLAVNCDSLASHTETPGAAPMHSISISRFLRRPNKP